MVQILCSGWRMTRRILIIGGSASLGAALAALGLESITTVGEFRDLVGAMPGEIDLAAPNESTQPAPKFGGDRPYLKKKKGRS